MLSVREIAAEFEQLSDEDKEELLSLLLKKDAEEKRPPTLPNEQLKSTKSFVEALLSIKLDGPPDFSSNLDDYLYHGKPFEVKPLDE